MPDQLTADQYIEALLRRQREWVETHSAHVLGWPPPLEWFVRPNDSEIFTPPKRITVRRPASKPVDLERLHRSRTETAWSLSRARTRLANANARLQHARDLSGGLLSFGGSGSQDANKKVRDAFRRAHEQIHRAQSRVDHYTSRLARLDARIGREVLRAAQAREGANT